MYTPLQSLWIRGAAGDPLPPVFSALEAKATRMYRGQLSLVCAGPGCLAADTEIIINRAGNGRRIRLDDLVTLFNGERIALCRNGRETLGTREWDLSIDTRVQCEIDGHMRSAKLRKAWFSGIKQTYAVRTTCGLSVRGTDIHPFKTVEGWTELGDLRPGDTVLVRGAQRGAGRAPKKRYATIKLANHPNRRGKKRLVSVHRLVAEAGLNGFSYDEWVALIRSGEDLTSYEFIPSDAHVHHKDENHLNNDPENLEILDGLDHLRHHATPGSVLHGTRWAVVESVTPFGEEPTYDLELDTEPHNFTANGFVVHNTGKSAFILSYALKARVPTLYFSADSDAFTQLTRTLSILTGWTTEKSARTVREGALDRDDAVVLDPDNPDGIPIRFVYHASPSVDQIETAIEAYDALYEDYPALMIVDNITNVRTDSEDNDPFAGLESLMDYLHDVARKTGAHVAGLHHVQGEYNNADRPIPLGGVKGQITRVPELVLTMFRSASAFGPDSLNVSTVKNRSGRMDASGKDYVSLDFTGETMQIGDRP